MPLQVSLRSFVAVEETADGSLRLGTGEGSLWLDGRDASVVRAVLRLRGDGATEAELFDIAGGAAAPSGPKSLRRCLDRLRDTGLTCYTLVHDGEPAARLFPAAAAWRPHDESLEPEDEVVLSRFAYLRRLRGALTIESPLALSRIELVSPPAALVVAALARPCTVAALVSQVTGLPAAALTELVALLLGERMLSLVGKDGIIEEDREQALRQWEFHDVLFHARSRIGRHESPIGAVFPHEELQPLPAVKPPMSADRIALQRADIDALRHDDPPFTWVLEERASNRIHAKGPIAAAQLGEFLFRAARVRRIIPAEERHPPSYETSSRPYPSAGATYELEIYLAIDRCEGLDSGLYHYVPTDHCLERVSGRTESVQELLDGAQASAVMGERPQVLVMLAARFPRLAWKYASIAYALALKDVGALYQTMYLVATAMGLAACALGAGDADLFAAAAGTDYLAEPSVGEFILGSKRVDSGVQSFR